ncbi:MAG: hypothetical protein U1F98_13720 [Verrucomicrobiota bacterium]
MTLSQYLLAWVDARGILNPLHRFQPAPNARWGLVRVAVYVAVQTCVAAMAGLVISLLLYRGRLQWWPIWWLGLFAFCQGWVVYGLTALCWNQRAAKLRADPQLRTGLPPSRFRPARWALWLVYFALLNLVTPLAMWITIENVRGEYIWSQFRREWEAKGEKFQVADVVPAPVPDDQNFALTPLLRPIFDFIQTTNGAEWRDTNGLARLSAVQISKGHARGESTRASGLAGLDQTNLTDLAGVAAFYRGNTNYPQPAVEGAPAADVLTALSAFDSELAELRDAAARRPLSRFPIHYDTEPPFETLLPHLSHIKSLTQVFALRAVAELDLHRPDEAMADLLVGFRLSDSVRNEPFLIDYLVRVATLNIDLQVVREGLARHAWTTGQLAQLQSLLGSMDLLAEYEQSMRGERCCNIGGLDYLARRGFRDWRYLTGDDFGSGSVGPALSWTTLYHGWLRQNQALIGRMYQDYLLNSVDPVQHRVYPARSDPLDAGLERLVATPYTVLVRMLMPAFGSASRKAARAQTFVDATLVACVIERYRLVHNQLPGNLQALVPKYLDRVPLDVLDGQPLRYRETGQGGYLLYSIGWNGVDDGGTVAYKKGAAKTLDISQGDWVWWGK